MFHVSFVMIEKYILIANPSNIISAESLNAVCKHFFEISQGSCFFGYFIRTAALQNNWVENKVNSWVDANLTPQLSFASLQHYLQHK